MMLLAYQPAPIARWAERQNARGYAVQGDLWSPPLSIDLRPGLSWFEGARDEWVLYPIECVIRGDRVIPLGDTNEDPALPDRDWDGRDKNGFDSDGYDEAGYNEAGFDEAGYDEAGYDKHGYNAAGFDEAGYDEAGFDSDGYDEAGFDDTGHSADGDCRDEACEECHCCTDCCEARGECGHRDDGEIPDYHHADRSIWRAYLTEPGPHYGVELETRVTEREAVYRDRPRGMIGELDGSLDEEAGVEWIGPPLPLASYADNAGLWAGWLATLRTRGARGHDAGSSYGLHVHVSRDAFVDRDHVARVVIAVNTWESLTWLIAQRTCERYAAIKRKDKSNALDGDSRYEAVNVTGEKTIEFRVFRSTLRIDRFRKAVQFCAALIEYLRDREPEEVPYEFLRWVLGDSRSQYPDLAAFLDERGGVQCV